MLQMQRSRRWAQASLAALGVSAGLVVVALAGRAPLSRSTPVDAASARAPVAALFVLVVGAGMVALGVLLSLGLRGRRGKPGELPADTTDSLRVHWMWKLLAILLPIGLGGVLIAAALLGARTVHHAPRFGAFDRIARPQTVVARAGGGPDAFALPAWLPWTALAVGVIALAVVVVVLVLRRVRIVREPRERIPGHAAVQAAILALDSASDPRSAVIAAYAAMERTLAEQGVTRSQSEAPREYLLRVLAQGGEAGREARTLTALFEEARFSTHPISEQLRERAHAALSSLRSCCAALEAG